MENFADEGQDGNVIETVTELKQNCMLNSHQFAASSLPDNKNTLAEDTFFYKSNLTTFLFFK